jgi:VWFA-related protein
MTRRVLVVGIILVLGLAASVLPVGAQNQGSEPPMNVPPGTPAQTGTSQSAPPQTTRPQSDTRARIRAETNLVVVPVTVKNRQGQLVGDLQRDEFRVLEDGVEQKIVSFTADPFPISAVVLIDNDLSQKSADQVQKSLMAIAAGFGPADEAALVTYTEFPRTVSDFSFNNDQLSAQLKALDLGSHFPGDDLGGPMTAGPVINGRAPDGSPTAGAPVSKETTDLDDALFSAAQMLKGRGRDRRKIVFLISDGNNSRHNEHSFDQTLQMLLAADVSVYSISVGHAFLQHETGRLEHYANGTGGDTFFASKQRDLERLYSNVTEQARNQYTLAFNPEDIDHKRDYHTLEVRVRRPDLNVSTRQGYYEGARAPH